MFYCKYCKKEVLLYYVNHTEGIEKNIDDLKQKMESDGKLILFNPPPIGSFNCPVCGEKLRDLI